MLHDLAKALKGQVNGRWVNFRGPGHGPSDRSLGIYVDPNAPGGFRVNSFAGDNHKSCRAYVWDLLRKSGDPSFTLLGPSQIHSGPKRSTENWARKIWHQGVNPRNTIVQNYFEARGLAGTFESVANGVIRYHPECPFGHWRVPAMVALIQNVKNEEFRGVVRIALQSDGLAKRVFEDGTPSKMTLGTAKHGAVMLEKASQHVAIAEGIETSLSASLVFGVPVWAALSAAGIATFPVIYGVTQLTIFADHDSAGLKAALACASRYKNAGIEGEVRYPQQKGQDWNDVLVEEQLLNGT